MRPASSKRPASGQGREYRRDEGRPQSPPRPEPFLREAPTPGHECRPSGSERRLAHRTLGLPDPVPRAFESERRFPGFRLRLADAELRAFGSQRGLPDLTLGLADLKRRAFQSERRLPGPRFGFRTPRAGLSRRSADSRLPRATRIYERAVFQRRQRCARPGLLCWKPAVVLRCLPFSVVTHVGAGAGALATDPRDVPCGGPYSVNRNCLRNAAGCAMWWVPGRYVRVRGERASWLLKDGFRPDLAQRSCFAPAGPGDRFSVWALTLP